MKRDNFGTSERHWLIKEKNCGKVWCRGRSGVLKTTRSWPAHQKCTEVQFLWKRLNGKKQPPKVWFFHGFSRCVFMVILYPLWAPMPCWWVWPAQVGFCRPFDPRSIFVVCELRSLRRLTRPMVVLRLVCGAETWKSHFRSTQYIQVRGKSSSYPCPQECQTLVQICSGHA